MKGGTPAIPANPLETRILLLRDQRVMLDADLAAIYGVSTRVLNQAVKRNRDRFPEDFMFRLTEAEKVKVITVCDHLRRLRFSPSLPHAFTEHGAIMLASVLNTPTAVQASVHVVRAFVRLREVLATHKGLARRLEELEKKYDAQFKVGLRRHPPIDGSTDQAAAPNRFQGRRRATALSGETAGATSSRVNGENGFCYVCGANPGWRRLWPNGASFPWSASRARFLSFEGTK